MFSAEHASKLFVEGSLMRKVEKISCINNAWFVMNFSVQWLTADGKWQTSEWNSGNYPKGQTRTSPSLTSLGVPADAILVSPYVQAVAGLSHRPSEGVRAGDNGQAAAYEVTGTTLIFTVEMKTVPYLSAPTWQNWSKNLEHSPGATPYCFTPHNLAELTSAVAKVVDSGSQPATLRVSGQRHSQPPLVIGDNRGSAPPPRSTAYLVDMSCYADLGPEGDQTMVLDLTDPANPKVTVNPGVREDDLDAFLTRHNLMLKTVTAGGFFSLGGMTAVDVHGATVNEKIFAETVSAFTIMGADGSVSMINAKTPAWKAADGTSWSPLQFARVSLGGLGIVTSVTIEVLPRPFATTLAASKETFTLSDESAFVAKYKTLVKHTRIESFLNPYNNNFLTLCWDEVDPSTKTPNSAPPVETACSLAALSDEFGAPYEGAIVEPIAEAVAQAAQVANSSEGVLPPGANQVITLAFGEIEKMYEAAKGINSDLWLTQAARVIFMSYFIELPDLDNGLAIAWKGLNAVSTRVRPDGAFHIAGPLEFRFVKGGTAAMSGTYTENPDSSWFVNLDLIAFVEAKPASEYPVKLLQFFADIERDWVAMGGFPHNGKMYGFYDPTAAAGTHSVAPFNAHYLADLRTRRGNRLTAFKQFRQQCDPQGLFYNQFLRELLED